MYMCRNLKRKWVRVREKNDKDDDGLMHRQFCRKPLLEVRSDDDDDGFREDPPFSDYPLVNVYVMLTFDIVLLLIL